MKARLADIAEAVDGELIGDGERLVDEIAPIESAGADAIAFVAQQKFRSLLATTSAACVIVAPSMREEASARGAAIIVGDPYLAYARLSRWWAARPSEGCFRPAPGVAASAVVEEGASVHATAHVGPLAYVGRGARIAAGASIGAQAHVGAGAEVGEVTRLMPRATLADGCSIGARGILHGGAVIGADGFGFAPAEGRWEKIEQLGAVRIGDDVEIGANTCIDRGALGDTVIGHGVKLDNLIQIAHNVRVGDHTAMAACVGIAGSATIGAHCMIGGAARIFGHIEICDRVFISTSSVISRSILQPGSYGGYFPFDENAKWERNAATLRQLYALRERLRALEKRVE